ncbi:hypothetical protein FQN50_004174 [Emmonsiellopsis sp. PD_5]|nr:hypothetical protein FQN50_004174 [Emmonsiellopsis sp. PD_5]
MATRRPKYNGLSPREIEIVDVLKRDEDGCSPADTYLVSIRGEKVVMRTYVNDDPEESVPSYFRREKAAYERLKAHGICDKGYVADYYGSLENADFTDTDGWYDSDPVYAIFLEHLPDLRRLDEERFESGTDRWERAVDGMRAIHEARVLHDNAMIDRCAFISIDEARERVLWKNFVFSSVYPEDKPLRSNQQECIQQETATVEVIGENMVRAYLPAPAPHSFNNRMTQLDNPYTDKCKGSRALCQLLAQVVKLEVYRQDMDGVSPRVNKLDGRCRWERALVNGCIIFLFLRRKQAGWVR